MEGPKPSPDRKSLWQALRSTEAGFGGRLLLPLAVSSVVSGVLFILWFIISMIIHLSSNRGGRFEMVGDEDVCILVTCVLAGLIYVAFLFVTFPWVLIFKLIRSFWFWGAVVATVLSSIVTVVLCVVADEWIRGEEEIIIAGIVLLASGFVLAMWVYVGNRLAGPDKPALSSETQTTDPQNG